MKTCLYKRTKQSVRGCCLSKYVSLNRNFILLEHEFWICWGAGLRSSELTILQRLLHSTSIIYFTTVTFLDHSAHSSTVISSFLSLFSFQTYLTLDWFFTLQLIFLTPPSRSLSAAAWVNVQLHTYNQLNCFAVCHHADLPWGPPVTRLCFLGLSPEVQAVDASSGQWGSSSTGALDRGEFGKG